MTGPAEAALILAVNPGSTSTKIALYRGREPRFEASVELTDAELASFRGRPIIAQLDSRLAAVVALVHERGVELSTLAATVGRGGLLRPVESGTYRVTDAMLDELRRAHRGDHASNLGAPLARRLAEPAGGPSFIVDPVSVDEWPDVARLSGLAGLDRVCLSHALNTKAVARRHARQMGASYSELRLVVAHMGSGHSVSAHAGGRMLDVTNSREEGAFSTERAGTVPTVQLVEQILHDGLSLEHAERALFREGGLHSYLGTRDLREVERRIDDGDERARLVFEAMLYQLRKEIAAMAAVLEGRVDAVLLTGGMAYSHRVTTALGPALEWIAPVHTYPGEDELRALAEGALRVLSGEESAGVY